MAGTLDCMFSSFDNSYWILDTGATNHMTYKHNWLFKTRKVQNTKVKLPNGIHSKVENIGSYKFVNKELQNVLHIPDFIFNLLPVSKLTTDLSCSITFLAKIVVLHDPSTGKVLGTGRESFGLYLIDSIATNNKDFAGKQLFVENCLSASLWHKHLGHASDYMLKIIENLNCSDNKPKDVRNCRICTLAKMQGLPFTNKGTRVTALFELIHADIWGSYHLPSYNNKRYILNLVDDVSRTTWVYLMQNKYEVILIVKIFFAMVENQFAASIKRFKSNNGGEFLN